MIKASAKKDIHGIQVIVNASAINFCNIGEYLDYWDFKCKKKLVDPLVEESTEDIDETKLINITLAENKNNYEHSSCMVYIVLMIVAIVFSTAITIYLVYYNWFLINFWFIALNLIIIKKIKIWWVQLYNWEQQNK